MSQTTKGSKGRGRSAGAPRTREEASTRFAQMLADKGQVKELPVKIGPPECEYAVIVVPFTELGMLSAFDHDAKKVFIKATDDAMELLKRIDHAAGVVNALVRQHEDVGVYEDLRAELRQLAKFVEINLSQRSPVRFAFAQAGLLGDDAPDDFDAPIERLEAARDAFYSLPPSQIEAITNGWGVMNDRPSTQDMSKRVHVGEVRSVLELSMNDRYTRSFREFVTEFGTHADDVCIIIQEGTTKADTIRHLQDAIRILREAWPLMIGPATIDADGNKISDVLAAIRNGKTLDESLADVCTKRPVQQAHTSILTGESRDRNGVPIGVGDVVIDGDGTLIATRGQAGGGRVIAIAGDAIIYQRINGEGFDTAQASACYVVSANEKGGSSPSTVTHKLGSKSEQTRAATTADAA